MRATTEAFGQDQQQKWITTYEYDDMGNWIKELTSEHSSPSQNATASALPLVQERLIQYYYLTENTTP